MTLQAPRRVRLLKALRRVRAAAPTRVEILLAVSSAALLILSFPNFDLWPLAWVGLVPLLFIVGRVARVRKAFLLGWMTGTLYFYGSCYWLTYSMIRYGHIPALLSYILLAPATLITGLFPGACMAALARLVQRWGLRALLLAPVLWAAAEWARLGLTGQLWNAVGYTQAYQPVLIQAARWGGVYLVGFLIVTVNASLAFALLQRNARALITAALIILSVAAIIFAAHASTPGPVTSDQSVEPGASALVIAVQPDVPMDPLKSTAEMQDLIARHVSLSERALSESERGGERAESIPRVVVWPESPMNFTYAQDTEFREFLTGFSRRNRASVIFNSLEPAPLNGAYNAALMVNEEGRLVAQYDKIRLLPFGEYVPLPRWLPGASLVPVMVGDFTPGTDYTLMPLGEVRAGVFICFESAFPTVAREFTAQGADVLINISNDGYLGPTPVMRQHLANAIFRAVENERPVLRVTNTGITAHISGEGVVSDATAGFQTAVRTWMVNRSRAGLTFYTRYGDIFAWACVAMSLLVLLSSSMKRRAFRKESRLKVRVSD